jgi:hypothetical protein
VFAFRFSSPHDPMNCEYVAQVVRVETLANKKLVLRYTF